MNLRIAGPVPLPPDAIEAGARPMINPPWPEHEELFEEIRHGLRWVFQTEQEVFVLTASGTGGLEAAIANLVSPGDKVLSAPCGAFGKRWADIAGTFGANVIR